MLPRERLILTLTHKTLWAYYDDRLAKRLLDICENVKMNSGKQIVRTRGGWNWLRTAVHCAVAALGYCYLANVLDESLCHDDVRRLEAEFSAFLIYLLNVVCA
jgi:hypothetical protein